MKECGGRGRGCNSECKELEWGREDRVGDVEKMVNEGKREEDMIKYVRDVGFVLMVREDLVYDLGEFKLDKKDVGEGRKNGEYLDCYWWMGRCIKRGKDGKRDKFEGMIVFGLSIVEGGWKKMVGYVYKERKKGFRGERGKSSMWLCEGEFSKLGKYMLEGEGIKLCREERELVMSGDKKGCKLLLRWGWDGILGDWMKEKMGEMLKR